MGAHVARVFSPSYFPVCPLCSALMKQTHKITAHTAVHTKRHRTSGKVSVRSGLPRHTERHLVQAYCTDNQNAFCNAIITQQRPRQLYYNPFKGHITLLTRTQRDMSLKAAGRAGCLPSR